MAKEESVYGGIEGDEITREEQKGERVRKARILEERRGSGKEGLRGEVDLVMRKKRLEKDH